MFLDGNVGNRFFPTRLGHFTIEVVEEDAAIRQLEEIGQLAVLRITEPLRCHHVPQNQFINEAGVEITPPLCLCRA